MEREIKFRAWNRDRKEWAHLFIGNGSAHTLRHTDGGHEDWQQYTGLKDKNGKEIFEGDVVKDDDNVRDGVREVRFGEEYVDASDYEKYSVGIIGFYLTNYLQDQEEYESLNLEKARHLEIIGNIYSSQP
jgi:uncharacterized phage protein (TIGR01671 family)